MQLVNGICVDVFFGSVLDVKGADGIVNAANRRMRGGGGVDGAIHAASGPEMLDELRLLIPDGSEAPVAQPVITRGYNLDVDGVVHIAGPIYRPENAAECEAQLHRCYMMAVAGFGIYSSKTDSHLAFSSISTGVYGFPIEDAARCALAGIVHAASMFDEDETKIKRITIAAYTEKEYDAYIKALTICSETLNGMKWLIKGRYTLDCRREEAFEEALKLLMRGQ